MPTSLVSMAADVLSSGLPTIVTSTFTPNERTRLVSRSVRNKNRNTSLNNTFYKTRLIARTRSPSDTRLRGIGRGTNGATTTVSVSDKTTCMCMARVSPLSIGIQCRNVTTCIKGNYSFSVRLTSRAMLSACTLTN